MEEKQMTAPSPSLETEFEQFWLNIQKAAEIAVYSHRIIQQRYQFTNRADLLVILYF